MKNNTILEVRPQGFCGGVMKAVQIAKQVRKEHPKEKITILGNLVHNQYVTKALEKMAIDTVDEKGSTRLDLLDQIEEGIVIFTAHGVSEAVYQKAKAKGLMIYDASCPFVLQTQKIVKEKLKAGFTIFYIGKNKHPEAESIYSLSDQVILIETIEDIPSKIVGDIFVTNQTTMSTLDIQDLFAAIKEKYPHAEFFNEICNATRVRQEAILNLKGQSIDALIVVGDPSSNNTNQLAQIGQRAGIPHIFKVESIESIQEMDFSNKKIAITSGASTPTYLTKQIIDFLKTGQVRPIEIDRILE